jgi:hypothetical protein
MPSSSSQHKAAHPWTLDSPTATESFRTDTSGARDSQSPSPNPLQTGIYPNKKRGPLFKDESHLHIPVLHFSPPSLPIPDGGGTTCAIFLPPKTRPVSLRFGFWRARNAFRTHLQHATTSLDGMGGFRIYTERAAVRDGAVWRGESFVGRGVWWNPILPALGQFALRGGNGWPSIC